MSPEAIAQNAIGVVLTANGEVFLKSEQGLREVEPGSPVYRGEELITGGDGSAEVRFADDTLLSQGAESSIHLDDYIYDETDSSTSDLLFKMGRGTFRIVTGEIAAQNPEHFKLGSPLATIGIRGTTTVHEIGPDGEKHGVEELHSGRALLIQSIDGSLRQISSPRELVDIASSGLMGTVRTMTVAEFNSFRDIAPAAMQQEQEIREQNEEEQNQQDNEEQQGGEDQQNNEEQQENADQQDAAPGESGQGPAAEQGMSLEGGGVLAAGENDFQGQSADAAMLAAAGEVFDALDEGDIDSARELLADLTSKLSATADPGTDADTDEIDELLGTAGTTVIDTAESDTPDSGTLSDNLPEDTVASGTAAVQAEGSESGETWIGTSGADYYDGRGGNDYIDGKEDGDTLKGGDGNDIILGNSGDDIIAGNADDDTISGNDGQDIIDGGPGDDYIYALLDGDSITGSSGTDTVSYINVTGHGVDANLSTGVASGGTSDDALDSIENLIGTSNGDELTGDEQNNSLSGLAGNDTIFGNDGIDSIDGGGGIDTIYGGTGADIIAGGSENDSLYGNDGGDTIYGNAGDDLIVGGSGDDVMVGGLGADTIYDDNGLDVFFYNSSAEGGDSIPDFHTNFDDFQFSAAGFSSDYGFTDTVSGNYSTFTGDLGSGAFFIFDGNDQLWYDPDVDTAGDQVLIATVGTENVRSADISVVGGDVD